MDSRPGYEQLLAARFDEATAALAAADRDYERIVEAGKAVATDDEHDPEGVGLAVERARIIGVLEGTRAELAAIAAARTRLEQGTYGRCAVCGATIDPGRLEARATTTTCITCASRPRRNG
ncbi:MAG: TraR/DksA C4-type zinc finger protein [Kineosporiaceae bacterium]